MLRPSWLELVVTKRTRIVGLKFRWDEQTNQVLMAMFRLRPGQIWCVEPINNPLACMELRKKKEKKIWNFPHCSHGCIILFLGPISFDIVLPPSKFHRRTSLGKVFKFYRRTAPACCWMPRLHCMQLLRLPVFPAARLFPVHCMESALYTTRPLACFSLSPAALASSLPWLSPTDYF